MKQFTADKEFRNVIDRVSNCCGAVVYPDSDICTNKTCGEHCGIEETCLECQGTGSIDVLDDMKQLSMYITPPIKTIACDKCDGNGYVEVDE